MPGGVGSASEDKSPVGGQLVDARNSTYHQRIFLNEVNQQMPHLSPATSEKGEKRNLGFFLKQEAD